MKNSTLRKLPKRAYALAGLLIIVVVGIYFVNNFSSGRSFPYNHKDIPASHNTGRLSIDFKKGATYQQTQEVFKKLNLTNTREGFMQLNILVSDPRDRVWGPVGEHNEFQAILEKLVQTSEVNHFEYAESAITVYFEPDVSEERARQVLADFKLTIYPGVNFQKNYSATVNVPKGEEPQYIKSLYKEKSVERAGELILTTQ